MTAGATRSAAPARGGPRRAGTTRRGEWQAAPDRPVARVAVDVALAHLDRPFDYLVPGHLDAAARPGVRLRVRFAGRLVDGYLLDRVETSAHVGKLAWIERVTSPEPVLTAEVAALCRAVADRYAGVLADVLRMAVPPRHAAAEKGVAPAAPDAAPPPGDAPEPILAAAPSRPAVAPAPAPVPPAVAPVPALVPPVGAPGPVPSPPGGCRRGVVAPAGVSEPGWARYPRGPALLDALAAGRAAHAVWQAVAGERWADRLADAAAATVAAGRTALLVVPDHRDVAALHAACTTRLTAAGVVPETLRDAGMPGTGTGSTTRSPTGGATESATESATDEAATAGTAPAAGTAVDPDTAVVVLTAELGPAQRWRRWLGVRRGHARIVIGTRSAAFAPLPRLGLLAVWDDGDDLHAEPRAPYPQVRDVLMVRAHAAGAALLVGGFARTAEAQLLVESGWAGEVVADRATVRAAAPRVVALEDSAQQWSRDPAARAARLPGVAFEAARAALAAGRPVLVQVPRSGYLPWLACAACRESARCRHCAGPLGLPGRGSGRGPDPEHGAPRPTGPGAGVDARGGDDPERAGLPQCRWCGRSEAAFRCAACGGRRLRAGVVGAGRTAEELGRAFPGVPVRASGGGAAVLTAAHDRAELVVATVGAEPVAPHGYGAALLLDGWALLARPDLRVAEETLRRWLAAAALVVAHGAGGRVVVVADAALPVVQALVRWDPVGHARAELATRTEVGFPPAVRMAAVDGTPDAVAEVLAELPAAVEVLGPVELPPAPRTGNPAAGAEPDDTAVRERALLRVPRPAGRDLADLLHAAQARRTARKAAEPVRVRLDPAEVG